MARRIYWLLAWIVSCAACLALAGCTTTSEHEVSDGLGVRPVIGLQDDRMVNPDTVPEERVAMLAETGVRMVRIDVFWKDIAPTRPQNPGDPADPAYEWGRVDATVMALVGRGITPVAAVYNAPEWSTGPGNVAPGVVYNSSPPDPDDYGLFLRAISRRYSGTFQADGTTLGRVQYWELWNEPNLSLFLSPEGGTERWIDTYADMVTAAYPQVKAGGGDETVVLVGATGPRGRTGPNAVGTRDWIDGLRKRGVPLDAYSQHIYPAVAPTVDTSAIPSWATLPEILDLVEQWKPGVGVHITEAGYTTAPTPFRRVAVSEADQARYLREIFDLEVMDDPRLRSIVWFNFQDNGAWPAGLIRDDESRKPSYAVFGEVVSRPGQRSLGADP